MRPRPLLDSRRRGFVLLCADARAFFFILPFVIAGRGGLELLFGKVKRLDVELAAPATVAELLVRLKEGYLKERPELFVQGSTVRPGILVLVNEADWELEGSTECPLSDGDTVIFISTLHGG